MKKLFVLAAAVVLAILAAPAGAATVVGTSHDLSGALPTTDQVCVFCHTAHQPTGTTTDPLWNHTLSTTAAYTPYASSTLNATMTAWGGGSGTVSSLCMSCHDGTVGLGSLYNKPNTTTSGTEETPTNAATLITGNALLGTDLSNDHPVNFTYDVGLVTADGGLQPVASVGSYLFGGTVQCASCHDAHNNTYGSFMRETNAGSALCLKCHIK
jgi:predicted CXXCH cytochrome family protein